VKRGQTNIFATNTPEDIMEKYYCKLHSFLDGDENCPDCKSGRVELPVKPACETLQKRFDIYANAINQIDDFFEYRYERLDKNQIKEVVMNIIDGITLKLSKSV